MTLEGRRQVHSVLFKPRTFLQKTINSGIQMLSIFRKLMKNDHGATAIEYTLIASLIAVAAITAMGKVGGKISTVLSNVSNAMS
jgi:pilus assembly protein Flp/PilA